MPHRLQVIKRAMKVNIAQPSIDFTRQRQVIDPTRRMVGFTGPLGYTPGELGKWTTFVEGGTSVSVMTMLIWFNQRTWKRFSVYFFLFDSRDRSFGFVFLQGL